MTQQPSSNGVAIVGIACRFPGGVTDPSGLWRFLTEGRDAITEIPPDRLDIDHFFAVRPATPGRIASRWGGYLDSIDQFDAGFFGIAPQDADRVDPQQRLLLETAWEALEDAGVDCRKLEGTRTGVFVGQWLNDFEGRMFADPEAVDFSTTLGSGRYAATGRISYALGLRGPCLSVDSACSAGLSAVHLAIRSIRAGESTLALAGGVNVILQPHIHIAYSQSRMMAPDGRCKFGDASADGYVRSDGVGMLVLKPLERARADGDRIYAVIRGSAVNNDGNSGGSMGSPGRAGQEDLLRTAYADAAIPPAHVSYVEAHGTGTRAGDPVELGALGAVLSEGRALERHVYVGSIKTNLGHTESAAGVAGLIKAALALHHKAIPQNLHFHNANPNIPWADLPLRIPTALVPWPPDAPLVAGVSAFGIGGSNAHVVLEGLPIATPPDQSDTPAGALALPLSARSPEAVRNLALRYADRLADLDTAATHRLCRAAAQRRTALEHRAAFVASTRDELLTALADYAAGGIASAEGIRYQKIAPQVVFVVPGQGAQWLGMARDLVENEPVFRAALVRCDDAARPCWQHSIVEQLQLDSSDPRYALDRIEVIQPVMVAMAIAYAEWLASFSIHPNAVIGHSMGEVGAAHLAGVLTLEQAMRIVCRRSALMAGTSGQGAMAMLDLSVADAEKRLIGIESSVAIAVHNGPRSCVISGEPGAIAGIVAKCEADGIFCRMVKVDVASHSPQMDAPSSALVAELAGLSPNIGRVPIYSTVHGRLASGTEFDARYWGQNLRQRVRFAEGITASLDAGATVFIELGPHPVLVPAVQQAAQVRGGDMVTAVACGRRDMLERVSAMNTVANAWIAGCDVNWSRSEVPAPFVPLPLYPWQRERHWCEAAELRAHNARTTALTTSAVGHSAVLGPATGIATTTSAFLWNIALVPARASYLLDVRLNGVALFPATVYLELALEARRSLGAPDDSFVRNLDIYRQLPVNAESTLQLRLEYTPTTGMRWFCWADGTWQLLAGAELATGRPLEPFETAGVVQGRCSDELNADAFYTALAERGTAIGPSLRRIARGWRRDGELLAQLTPPDGEREVDRLTVDASTLDACLQLARAVASGDRPAAPAHVAGVRVYRPASGVTYVHAVRASSVGGDSIDVRVLDERGLVADVEGISFEPVHAPIVADPSAWLYDIVWREEARSEVASPRVEAGRWIVIETGARADIRDALVEAATRAGRACVVVGEHQTIDAALIAGLGLDANIDVIDLRGLEARSIDAMTLPAALARLGHLAAAVATHAHGARLWTITSNAHAITDDEHERLVPAQAAFWGAGATVAIEHGDVWAGCIDIDESADLSENCAAIVAHVTAAVVGDVALRRDKTFVRRLHRLEKAAAKPSVSPLRADAAFLLTGGLGGVGVHLATALVEHGVRRLVVLGRTVLPPRTTWRGIERGEGAEATLVNRIRRLEARGATVHYASVDVGDAAAVRGFFDAYSAEGWPDIVGVIHAAGVLEDRLVSQLDQSSWARVLHGKAVGAWNLYEALPRLDYFILVSSLTSVIPQPGQSAYAAANAILDALARQRRASGRPATSISWGVWRDVGLMEGELGRSKLDQMESRGIYGFSPRQGAAIFRDLLTTTEPHVVVAPVDWMAFAAQRTNDQLRFVSELTRAHQDDSPIATAESANDLDPVAQATRISKETLEAVARVLRMNPSRIDTRRPLGTMGLSSLLAIELRNKLEVIAGRPLSATVAWNYPTVDALVGFLAGKTHPSTDGERVASTTSGAEMLAVDTSAVSELSDEEAVNLLRRRR